MGALGIMNFEFLSLCGAFMVFFYLRTPGTERKCPKEVGQEVEFTICSPTGCETPEVAENWAKLRVQQKKLSAEIVESQLYAWFYPQFYVLCIRVLGTGVQLIHYNTPFGWRNNFEMCQLAAIMIADNKLTDMWLQGRVMTSRIHSSMKYAMQCCFILMQLINPNTFVWMGLIICGKHTTEVARKMYFGKHAG